MAKDYYAILGVSCDAGDIEIKRAFRLLAQKYHPDKLGGDEKKFKEVSEAYAVLSNPQKRRQYDTVGSAAGSAGDGGFQHSGFSFDFGSMDDVFSSFFGGVLQKGNDIHQTISLSFKEAVLGVEKPITISYRHKKQETLTVPIPSGTQDGTQFQLQGKGEPSVRNAKAPPGDLILKVSVSADPHYTMNGADLVTRVNVKLSEAILGATRTIPSVEGGTLTVTIPPGTRNNQHITIPRAGVPTSRGRGNLTVVCAVETPPASSREIKRVAQDLASVGW